ncbi:YncE family protein [Vulgatibacter sp.]|uniref:YncE family protein n=1 Tax=Vulgatibacter sp. TaxID=1971226 RepID=UPI003564512D
MKTRFWIALRLGLPALLAVVAAVLIVREGLETPERIDAAAVRVEHGGLAVDFRLRPIGGATAGPLHARGEAEVELGFTDAKTGAALPGLRPLAWMDRGDHPTDAAACTDRIRGHLAGLLATRADVDLNGYLVLTRNDDNTLAVINPQIAFGRTKLEAVITLGGKSADWAITEEAIWITLPAVDRVTVVDPRRLRVDGSIGVGDAPGPIAVAPDGSLWVGNEGDGTVSVIDPETRRVRGTVAAGGGAQRLAFHAESGTAYVAGSGDEGLRVVDLASLESRAELPVGRDAVAVAASSTARAIYVARRAGEVIEIDPFRHRITRRIPVDPGVSALAVVPGGRWVLVASADAGTVAAIDASSGAVRHTFAGLAQPAGFAFSEDYVYVRSAATAQLGLLDRAGFGTAAGPRLVEVMAGQFAPGPSGAIAALPEPGSVLVANPADKALYLYTEGMMAPMGTHRTYGKTPVALAVLDRSLQEVAGGRHRATVPLRGGGRYTVSLLTDSPRTAICFTYDVEGVPSIEPEAPALHFAARFDQTKLLEAGTAATLPFELRAPGGAAIEAAQIGSLVYRLPGTHQLRPAVERRGDGYAISFTPPAPGRYRLLVAGPGTSLGDLPPVEFGVAAAPNPATAGNEPR